MRNSDLLKKAVLTAAIFSGGLTVLNAQTTLSAISRAVSKQTGTQPQWNPGTGDFHVCPSGRLTHDYIMENGLQGIAAMGQLEKQNTPTEEPAGRVLRTVPVVFHVVYANSSENVSDAVINELLERLNEDFRKLNALIPSIRPAFAGVAADAQIQFCLATKDPNGNTMATPGITRRQTTLTWFDSDASNNGINYVNGTVGGPSTMKGPTYGTAAWDRTKYINIWICDITNGAQSGTAGYAYVPQGTTTAGLPPANIDGVVLDYNIGVQGGQSRAVSHEVGHYFGLDHTWGDANGTCNTGDDGFSDTPLIKGPFQNYYFSCTSGTGANAPSCTAGTLWQHENLMDYSDCFCMFTTQQANHMNAVLSGSRNSLNTSYTTNCTAPAPQVPVAAFTGCSANVASGSTVTFTDASTGVPTSWAWSITPATGWTYVGGTSATSQNPQVQFTTQGTYSVTLTATNAQGSDAETSASCITVVAAAPCNTLATALTMGFETSESLTGWTVENTNNDVNGDGDPNTWGIFQAQSGLTAHGGTQMIGYLYNEDGVTSANDWFFTPCLALQSGTTYSISFWHKVGSSGGTTYPERLRVKIGNTNTSAAMTQTIVDLGTLTNTGWVQSTTTFTVPSNGNYNIGFQCYSLADEFFLVVDDINISAQTPVVVAPQANFTGCGNITTGNTVTFTNTSTNSPTSYSWSITPGTGWSYTGGTNATSANPQVTFTTAGTYTVALTATNSAGSNTKTSNSCVVVTSAVQAPQANFTGCGNYTVGNIVTFTNTSTNSPTSYAWSITPATGWFFAGGTSASSASPQVVFTAAGTYNVALTATNSAGSNTKTSNSCVIASVAAQAPVAGFTGCGNFSTGSTITLNNTSTNSPTSYAWSITPGTGWSFAGGTNATSPNPQITFTTAGTYTIALTATNSAGSDTETGSNCVVVSNGTVTPVASFTGCGTYTTGSTVTLTNTSSNTPTSYAWSITPGTGWSFTGGTNANSANPQVTFTTNGTYTIALTAGNSAGNHTATSNSCVVISTTGAAPVADFLGCLGSIASGTTVTFANTSLNQPTSNQWQIVPGTGWTFVGGTNANSASIQVQFTAVGPYSVSLTSTNAMGSNTKTTNNCVVVEGVGIDEAAEFSAGIALYPNPTNGMAALSIGNMEQYSNLTVTVYNAVGVQVYKTAGNLPSEITLDMTAYSAGIYFVEVRANEAVATKRLVLSK